MCLDLDKYDFLYRIKRNQRIIYVSVPDGSNIPPNCRTGKLPDPFKTAKSSKMEGEQLEKTHMHLYRIETESFVDMNTCQKSSIICEKQVVQVVGRDCRRFMYVLTDSMLKFILL